MILVAFLFPKDVLLKHYLNCKPFGPHHLLPEPIGPLEVLIQVPSKIGIIKLIFKALLSVNDRRPETGSSELPRLLLLREPENALALCI